MDKTLSDYIVRAMAKLELEKQKPDVDKNQYLVYPENKEESDLPQNPYSQV